LPADDKQESILANGGEIFIPYIKYIPVRLCTTCATMYTRIEKVTSNETFIP